MTSWWMDPRVVWYLLGVAATAGIMLWRVNQHEKRIVDLDKRMREQEQWSAGAEKVLGFHEKLLSGKE